MLVLSRRKNERIVIADKSGKVIAIVVLVEAAERGKTRTGTDAGPETMVHRAEVYEKIYGHGPVVGERVADPVDLERTPHPAVQLTVGRRG